MQWGPKALIEWGVAILIWIVLIALAIYLVAVLMKWPINEVKRYWRDRYKRRWRKGKWVPRCDVCDDLAHHMAVSKNMTWGTGGKRCWTHLMVQPPLVTTQYQAIMPMNRETAWVTDKPIRNPESRLAFQLREAATLKNSPLHSSRR
jgi:hypothetical protein